MNKFKKYIYSFYMIANNDFIYCLNRDLYKKLGGHHMRGSNKRMDIVCFSSFNKNNILNNNIYFGRGDVNTAFVKKYKTNFIQFHKFLYFVKHKFNGKYYVLNLWGHGYGWKSTLPFYFDLNKYPTVISLKYLNYSLSKNKFDILSFETCAGMSIETIYELKKNVKFICGNSDYTSNNGIQHKKLLSHDGSPELFCKKIVKNMKNELCPSFTRTSKSVFIKKKINKISSFLEKDHKLIIKMKKQLKKKLVDSEMVDIGYMLSFIIKNSKSKKLINESQILKKYLKKNIFSIPKKRFKQNNCAGINIWFPKNKNIYNNSINEYKKLQFSKNNKWIKILQIAHKDK